MRQSERPPPSWRISCTQLHTRGVPNRSRSENALRVAFSDRSHGGTFGKTALGDARHRQRSVVCRILARAEGLSGSNHREPSSPNNAAFCGLGSYPRACYRKEGIALWPSTTSPRNTTCQETKELRNLGAICDAWAKSVQKDETEVIAVSGDGTVICRIAPSESEEIACDFRNPEFSWLWKSN